MFVTLPVPVSVLAFITTIHVAMLVLRVHRSPTTGIFSFVTPVSLMFAASPWMLSTQIGQVIGLAAHLGWFVACERLLPVSVATTKRAMPAPAAPPRGADARAIMPVAHAAALAARPAAPTAPVRRAPSSSAAAASLAPAASARPRDFVPVPVVAVFDETPNIRTFRLARPDAFEFVAGQFLTVRLRADGKEYVRCYSISSPPGARGHLEITVKRLGSVSGTLHALVRPGTMLSVRAPAGAFHYPSDDDRPIVLVAGGVGITPLMAMLRHATDTEPARPVTLLYSVKTEQDLAFYDEIRLLTRRHAQFRSFILITESAATNHGMNAGRLDAEFLISAAPDIAHATCMVCGPPPMIDAVAEMLVSVGVPKTQIHWEVFNPAVASSAEGSAVRERPPRTSVPAPAARTASFSYEIHFARSGLAGTVRPGQTLLEASEECGDAPIPSLCRAGVCGTCRTRVVSGDVFCPSQTLDAQDRADGYVLPCVSHAHSDCVLEA